MATTAIRRVLAAASVGLIALLVGMQTASAQVPVSMTHQGRLLNDAGEPMTGSHQLQFRIYDAREGGAILWESMAKQVDLGDTGFYSVTLGQEGNAIDAEKLVGGKAWITMRVDGGEELTPRMKLQSVPYALRAGKAESVVDGSITDAKVKDVSWSKITGAPETLGDLNCSDGQQAVFSPNGNWKCADQTDYSGQDFALSDQSCNAGDAVIGFDENGKVVCQPDKSNEYKAGPGLTLMGKTFQLAQQNCPMGKVAIGVDASGSLRCRDDRNTVYNRDCPMGQVVTGVDATGSVTCGDPVTAGAGLNLTGTTIELAAQSCTSGLVAAGFDSNGNLICRPDQDSGGDITSVSAGTGLNGGSASGSVDLDVDYDDVQQRVNGSCPDGEFIDSIDRDGTVNCEPLSGSTSCSSGDFAKPSGGCPFDVNSVTSEDGPACDEVAPGSYCEYDSSSGCGLDGSLNNCSSFDWYLKLQ